MKGVALTQGIDYTPDTTNEELDQIIESRIRLDNYLRLSELRRVENMKSRSQRLKERGWAFDMLKMTWFYEGAENRLHPPISQLNIRMMTDHEFNTWIDQQHAESRPIVLKAEEPNP